MYGLDAYVLAPPYSALVSILLILSCDAIGVFLIRFLNFEYSAVKWVRWQAPVIGAAILAVIFYPFALTGFAGLAIFRIAALCLIAISCIHLFMVVKQSRYSFSIFIEWFSSYPYMKGLLLLLMLSFALFSLSPITNADSLDYHVGVALHILDTGMMPVTPEWFHSRISGNGEVLNAIGFAVGAEQFGSLLQFVGLVGVVGLIYHAGSTSVYAVKRKSKIDERWRLLLAITAASSPVLVFLIGSVKPQLLPVGMTTLAMALCFYPSRRELDDSRTLKGFGLICMLVMTASQAKFSFLLGGGVVGVIALFLMARKKLLVPAVVIGVVSFIFIMMPPVLWKSVNFTSGFFNALLTPFPGDWYGTAEFETALRNYHDSELLFPFSLVIPSSLGVLSTIIGIGIGLFVFLKPQNSMPLMVMSAAAFFVFVAAAMLGPPTSRSYLEPYFWLLMVLAMQSIPAFVSGHFAWFQTPISLQTCLVLGMCWYGIVTALPGVVSSSARNAVMNKMANGYSVMEWVGKELPGDAIVMSQHRAIGLTPRKAVSLDWMKHSNVDKNKSIPYLYRIKDNHVTHLLVQGENYKTSFYTNYYSNCLTGDVIKSHLLHFATRNPFNKGKSFTAWLIPFDSKLLPECVLKNK